MAIVHNGEIAKDIHLITVSEPLIGRQAEDFKGVCQDLLAQGVTQIVIDLETVPLIDSRGLAALVAGYKIFGGDSRTFRLAGLQNQPKLVFDLTGFDHILELYDSVLEAVLFEEMIPAGATVPLPILMPQWAVMN